LIQLDLPEHGATVRSVLEIIASRPDFRSLKALLVEGEGVDPRPNALIMVSGREIGALDGLDTLLAEGDELSLLPIAHGG
jgi:molybdopterin converting factor small subunit